MIINYSKIVNSQKSSALKKFYPVSQQTSISRLRNNSQSRVGSRSRSSNSRQPSNCPQTAQSNYNPYQMSTQHTISGLSKLEEPRIVTTNETEEDHALSSKPDKFSCLYIQASLRYLDHMRQPVCSEYALKAHSLNESNLLHSPLGSINTAHNEKQFEVKLDIT